MTVAYKWLIPLFIPITQWSYSVYISWKIREALYCKAPVIRTIPCKHCGIAQPRSYVHTPLCLLQKITICTLKSLRCHWVSSKGRCGSDSFQKATVTVWKLVGLLLVAFLQHCYTIGTKNWGMRKTQLPKIHSPCSFSGYGHWKMCWQLCVVSREWPPPLLHPFQSG